MSIVAWNVNGACADSRARHIADFLLNGPINPEIIGIIETKCAKGTALGGKLFGYNLVGVLSSDGKSGGIEVWCKHSEDVNLVDSFLGRVIAFDWFFKSTCYRIFLVYGSFDVSCNNNIVKWIEKVAKRGAGKKVLIVGDFNHLNFSSRNFFENFVDGFSTCGVGSRDTWSRTVNGKLKASSLDKVLHNLSDYPVTYHVGYPLILRGSDAGTRISDHKPLWITLNSVNERVRWMFPEWTLQSIKVVNYIKSIISSSKSWYDIADTIRINMSVIIGLAFEDRVENKYRFKNYVSKIKCTHDLRANKLYTGKLQSLLRGSTNGSIRLEDIQSYFSDMYSEHFDDDMCDSSSSESVQLPTITSKDVFDSIDALSVGKSPGPSGFAAGFFKKFKDLLAPVLACEFNDFLTKGHAPSRWKRGYITLVPKKGDLTKIENWRGINLVNVEWKIFSKIMDVFLRKKFESQVFPDQIGFIRGKWMQQHTVVLQTALQKFKHSKSGGVLFIDLKNAYPSVRHSWIRNVFQSLGGSSLRKLANLLLGGRAQVFYRGKLSDSFPLKRGVKQGDVAAAFMFNLALDSILRSINVKGVDLFGNNYKVLAYADDLVVFCSDEKEQDTVRKVFESFEFRSGLTINESKTFWMPYLHSKTGSLWNTTESFSYLGTRLDRRGNVVWTDVMDKFKVKMDKIKALMNYNNSLEFQINMINVYCIPVFFHILRVNSDINEIWDTVYNYIRITVGSRCTRVALDRLLTSKSNGGYGLININDMDKYMKRTWISYVVRNKDARFASFICGWNEATKADANTVVGPIMSWNNMNGESKFLRHISSRWKKVKFFSSYVGTVCKWNYADRSTGAYEIVSVDIKNDVAETSDCYVSTCDYVPISMTDIEIIRKHTYKIVWKDRSVAPSAIDKSFWKIRSHHIARYTTKQAEWKSKFKFRFDKEINRVSNTKGVPIKIKMWYRDLLNFNIKVRYRKDMCNLCGEEVGGSHFVFDCSNMDKIKNLIKLHVKKKVYRDVAVVRWCNWIAHCRFDGRVYDANVEAVKHLIRTLKKQKLLEVSKKLL